MDAALEQLTDASVWGKLSPCSAIIDLSSYMSEQQQEDV